MMKIPALFVLLTATSITRVASYGVIHRHDHIDDERYERHVRAMYALDDLLSEYNRLHDHPDPDYHRQHREPEFVKAHKDTHHHHAQHARRKEALHKAHGDVPIACDDFVSMQATLHDCMKHPTWEVPYGDCCEGLRVWNDAGCNCPDTKTVLSHDVTFAHYAKLAATFTPVCQVDVSSFQCETSSESSSGHFHLALPKRLPHEHDSASLSSNAGRGLKQLYGGTSGKQEIDCADFTSAMITLLPCLGAVPATVSEECCKGLNTWNDAGCYCDGVASVLDDPNTPSAYVALARELNPACAVEKTTDTNHRTCAPPPPAPPPLPPPPRPPPEPPASSTLAFATTIAEETWGASFKSFVPDTWNAPTDEEYCGWMKDVLICDYFKTQDECDWADSDGGGSMEVLTPCEWYDGKCELRDPMQLGARELRNAFRNVLAASRSTHDACAASSACDGEACVATPHGCVASVDTALAAAEAHGVIHTSPAQRMVYTQYMHGIVECNAGGDVEATESECFSRDGCHWDAFTIRCEPTREWRNETMFGVCEEEVFEPPPAPPAPPADGYIYERTRGDGLETELVPWQVWLFTILCSGTMLAWELGFILVYKRNPECPKPESSDSDVGSGSDSDEDSDEDKDLKDKDEDKSFAEVTMEVEPPMKVEITEVDVNLEDDGKERKERRRSSRRGRLPSLPPWPKYAPQPYNRRKSTRHRKASEKVEGWEERKFNS